MPTPGQPLTVMTRTRYRHVYNNRHTCSLAIAFFFSLPPNTTRVYTRIHIHTHTHTYIHTYIHTHTHSLTHIMPSHTLVSHITLRPRPRSRHRSNRSHLSPTLHLHRNPRPPCLSNPPKQHSLSLTRSCSLPVRLYQPYSIHCRRE